MTWVRVGILLLGLATLGCRLTDVPMWRLRPSTGTSCPIEIVRDIPYTDAVDHSRHSLDLYLPVGKADYPVVLFVHGGGWIMGDNRCCGLHASVGEFLASQGIGVAMPNYRLSPGVKHPTHIQDVARAFAWVRHHFGQRIHLVGHSAGGHLVSLLATDERYLREVGCQRGDIQSVTAISGVYAIPQGDVLSTLGGTTSDAFYWDVMFPLRGEGGWSWMRRLGVPGLPIRCNFFGLAFGDDANIRRQASPIHHICPGLPRFLLLNAEHELPMLATMAEEFRDALAAHGCDVQHHTVLRRNHNSILFRAIETQDPVAAALLAFIRQPPASNSCK